MAKRFDIVKKSHVSAWWSIAVPLASATMSAHHHPRHSRSLAAVSWLHALATYGEADDEAHHRRELWDDHCLQARAEGVPRRRLFPQVLASTTAHVTHRLRSGEVTALPTAILLLPAAGGAAAFAAAPDDVMPARVHLHFAFALLVASAVFFCWPRWQPRSAIAVMGVILGTATIHMAREFVWERPADGPLLTGMHLVTVGAALLLAFALSNQRRWRQYGLICLAIGSLVIGVADLDWYRATHHVSTAISYLVAGGTGVLLATTLIKLSMQTPPDGYRRSPSQANPH